MTILTQAELQSERSCCMHALYISAYKVQLSSTDGVRSCRLNQEQGTNAVLRSSLERKERERDDLQRRMQQLSSQPTALSSFNMAEAQKQVATLTQQLAFKEAEVCPEGHVHTAYMAVVLVLSVTPGWFRS